MKQVLIRRGEVTVPDVPPPLIQPSNILVAVAYSLISTGTEISSVEGSSRSTLQRAIEQPEKVKKLIDYLKQHGLHRTIAKVQGKLSDALAVGYSCAGTVVQVGAGVTDLQVGDQVACAGAGKANHAEWILVPRNLVVPVPTGVSLRDASSTTVGAIALQGARRADLRLGEWAIVIGLGLLGQISVQLLKANGVRTIGLDVDPRRVQKALLLGLEKGLVPSQTDPLKDIFHWTQGHGADVTIITAASQGDEVVQQAMHFTRIRGRVIVVGAVGLGLKRSPFYEKELDFLIARSYGPGRYDPLYEEQGLDYPYSYVRWTENRNMGEYLRLLAENSVNFGSLIEAEFPISEADRAYAALQRRDERPIAVVLRYPDAAERSPKPQRVVLPTASQKDGHIRIALVGAGDFARGMHLPNLTRLKDQYHLRAVVDLKGSNAWNTGEQYGANYVTSDFAEVLADPEVDMVLLTTRHHLHAEQAIQAAQAGKAIFVEKPMAIHSEELDRLAAVLEGTRVPYMVGFNRRFSPAAKRAKEITKDLMPPFMILYRVNAGYIPLDHWVHSSEGGGRIIGEACHMFDFFQFLLSPATPVLMDATSILSKAEHISASDNMVITVRYSDGSTATLLYTALGANELPKEQIEIYGAGKTLVLEDYRALHVFGSPLKGWEGATQDKGHLDELRAFADYVCGKSPAPIPLSDMIATTRLTLEAAGKNLLLKS